MDRLVEEKIKQKVVEQETAEQPIQETAEQPTEPKIEQQSAEQNAQNKYVQSFEGRTVADIIKEKQTKEQEEFKKEKEELLVSAFEPATKKVEEKKVETKEEIEKQPVNIIEKPNYDLLQEPKKTIKLKKTFEPKRTKKRSFSTLVLSLCLVIVAGICVINCSVIDNMQSNLTQIEESYNLRLDKYLKNIYNLDTSKKSMEFLETYPDEVLKAGDLGQKTNWFDKFCNFLAGLFGG